jgi:hypothetical protein
MSSTWTTEEIQKMNEMISMKKSFGKIAKELGRTQLAVKYKFGRQYRKENKVATPEIQDISHVENMADNIYINNKDISNYVNTIGSIVIISCIGIVVYGTRVYVQIFLDSIQKIRQF